MLTFLDHKGNEIGALTTFKYTNSVNGERSLSGTVHGNLEIEKGWGVRFEDEHYKVIYAKPQSLGKINIVQFDAVHQFFWDFDKSSVYSELDGSYPFQTFLDHIFNGSGYRYNLEVEVGSLRKQNFGLKKRLELFNDLIKHAGVEFQVRGKVVRILERTGTDLSTVVRKKLNLNDLSVEKRIGDFITYQKGLGAWHDENDHSKGRLEVEYVSPLAAIYGRLEGEPYVDERFTIAENFLEVLKKSVEDSYSISVQLTMEDLQKAGYRYTRPLAGDYITVIDEDINFKERVRIVSFETEYDIKGQVIGHTVTCNDIGSVKKQSVGYSSLKSSVADVSKETESAIKTANRALVSADGKSTVYFGTEFPQDVPKGTLTKGDTLYLEVGDTTKMYYWNGAEWLEPPVVNDVEAFKESINTEIAQVNQSMQAQSEEHDRQVADILSKTQSIETLANQAKSDAASAIARANQVKAEAIADARAQVATVSQVLNTAKTDLQTAIASADQKARDSQASATALRNDLNSQANKILAQAQAQTALTSRVTTVETLADGTKTTVAELSKTVNKATGDIASVTSRTKTVEDTLSQTRTQYEALTQTVNAQTGQIDSINRKTADLQSGIDGVNNRFETIWVSEKNLLSDTETLSTYAPLAYPANNYLGRAIKRITKSANTSAYAEGLVMQTNETLVNPKEMILSFYVKANRDARIRCFMYNPNANKDVATSDGYTAKSSADGMAVLNVTTSWQRVWIKWTYLVNYLAKPRIIIGRIIESYDTDVSVDISAPALYHGHHNKEWSPADLDFKNELATYVQNAQESSAELVRRIETADGKAVDAKAYAQQTANGFNTRIESLESYKNAEGTRASQYLTASRTETAKQLSAERVAIANNYLAKSTYTEDVRGTTQKLNEIKTTADTAKQNLATYQNTVDRKLEELTSSTQTLDGKINTASAKVDTVAGQIRTEISTVEGKIPTTIGATNYIRDFGFANNPNFNSHTSLWKYERIADSTARSGYHIKATCTQSGSNGFHRYFYDLRWARYQGRVMTYSVDIKASKSVRMRLGAEAFNKGYKAFDVTTEWQRFVSTDTVNFKTYYSFPFYADTITWAVGDIIYIRDPQLEDGTIATTPRAAEEDLRTDISSIKTTITQTASGVEQLSTSLSTTNNKVSTAETKINQLISDVSSKVSQTDYNTLTGRVSSAETAITQNATEISKRLTSTQVDKAITDKGYATVTVLENKVRETADSFGRTITETRALIPNNMSNRNLALGTSDSWSTYVSTNSARSDWRVEICRIDFNHYKASVGKKLNLFVHILADNVTLDSSSSHKIAIQAYVLKKDGSVLWHGDNPFHRQWVRDLKSGNNYHIVKLSKEVKPSIYEEGARLVVECRIDGANHVDFHHRAVMVTASDIFPDAWSPAPEDVATVTALHDVKDTVSSHTRTIGAIGETGSILDNVSKVTQTANGLVTEVSGSNGLKTQVSTLAGSYAIKNLTSAGNVLGQLNLNPDGSVRINEGLISIGDKTYIKNGVIKSAMIGNGQIGTAHIGEIDAGIARIINLDVSNIKGLDAEFIKAKIENAFIGWMKGKTITAQNSNMTIDLLNGMITMRNSGKFIVDGGYAEFARQEGLVKASLAFHDNASTKNGIKLSVDDGLGKSTSIKSIWLNERNCYISDFDEISLHTASGNGIRITKDALEFTVGGTNYIWGKTTFDKITKL
ncbi:TPA: phage tail protein [Streptococcus suis]